MRATRRQLLAGTGLLAGSLFLPSRRALAGVEPPPKRLVIFFTQHGTVYPNWRMRPGGRGEDDIGFVADLGPLAQGEFSPILQPLHAFRDKLLVVDGLSMASAEADITGNGHDIGTRQALTGAFLSGSSAGGPSVDQIVAQRIRLVGRIDSLELAIVNAMNGGAVWRDAEQSIPPDANPSAVFSRVFPPSLDIADPTDDDRVRARQASVLDLVKGEYSALAPRLSAADRAKLELHRDLVRDVELRVAGLATLQCTRPPEPVITNGGDDAFYGSRAQAMFQMTAAALACDLTRVVTIQAGQLYNNQIGAPPGDVHADFAHNAHTDDFAREMMTNYHRLHAEQFASLLGVLDAIPEGDGTLLDHCAVVWCNELADGQHNYRPWPVVVAGGTLGMGRYVSFANNTPNPTVNTNWPGYEPTIGPPHNRFWVSVARSVGADVATVGEPELTTPSGERIDCSGGLEELG